jgi:ABC-type polysaccharide/polyol phosphate transport system ATPase subunit
MSYLHLRDAWVEFPIYQGGSRSLKKALLANTTKGNLMRDALDRINVVALRDLNLSIKDGDRLALIGQNGAGKSTLLKVLAGIYQPTRGRLHGSGKVTALLTNSVGLNPEATGRENIILRGMYLGIHPREMMANIDEIADFTELGAYLDMPVRTYSSGMMVRLSFAASTAFAPEILLMDEWLSAGDASFLTKAQKRLEHFVGNSSILVLASHSIPLLKEWCNRAILLDHGGLLASGSVSAVADSYKELIACAQPIG